MIKSKMPAIVLASLMVAAPAAVLGSVMADASQAPEALLADVNNKLDKLNGEVKATAEKALAEAKNAGEVSNETKAAVDTLLVAQNALKVSADALTATLEGVQANVLEISQSVAAGGSNGHAARMTMGQAVVTDGKAEIQNFLANGATGNLRIGVANAITTADGSGGGLIYHDEERSPVAMARRALRIRDLISSGRTGSDAVKYRKQTLHTDATAMVAEAGTYPESAFGWTKASADVKKIGAVTNISEETMADADQLQSEIDVELRYGLDLEMEKQILAGDGLGENLSGLVTEATAFAAVAGLPNATPIDRLRLAILQIVLADYIPTAFILNPTDWAEIDLLKETTGAFVFGNPGAQSTPVLWGKAVVESNTMTANEWLAGDMAMAATLYDRSEAEVLISSEHGTNFVEDMLTMKARQRVALAVKRPAALVTGNFTFI